MESPNSPPTGKKKKMPEKAIEVKRKPRKAKVWPNMPATFGERNQYEFRERIASGGYAFVYSGYDLEADRPVAIKVPNIERLKAIAALKKERKFLNHLHKGGAPVPEPLWFGTCGDRPVLVMELLGDCLGEVRKFCGRSFSLATILKLAIELIECSEKVHDCGILHRDCKLKNYLLGAGNRGMIRIVDFGLSDKWQQKNGEHVPFQKNLSPFGTMRYAPIAVHVGHQQGRKDDLEALGYLLIYLARGKLPWQNLWHAEKQVIWRDVGRMKAEMNLDELCAELCPCFEAFMNRLRHIEYADRPPYDELKQMFLETMINLNIDPSTPYDWEMLQSADSEESEETQ